MSTVMMTTRDEPVARPKTIEEPRIGDVVVVPDLETPGCFTIRQVSGSPTMLWDSRGEAVGVAQGFARARGVDVWLLDGRSPELLHAYRGTPAGRVGR